MMLSVFSTAQSSTDSAVELQSDTQLMKTAYESFQKNADIIRLVHLKYWVELIEEYHEKTGYYPFEGESVNQIYVELATPRQQVGITQHAPAPAVTKTMAEFVQVLEAGLGRTINEYYDPQFVMDYKPNFYVYMIEKDTYYFAIHTHQKYLFSKTIAPNYHKVEVSNVYNNSANLVVTPQVLFSSGPYQIAVNKEVYKKDFFVQRANESLHATKETSLQNISQEDKNK